MEPRKIGLLAGSEEASFVLPVGVRQRRTLQSVTISVVASVDQSY